MQLQTLLELVSKKAAYLQQTTPAKYRGSNWIISFYTLGKEWDRIVAEMNKLPKSMSA